MDWNGLGLVAALYSRDKDLAALVKHSTGRRISNTFCSKPFSYSFRSKTPHIRVPVPGFTFGFAKVFRLGALASWPGVAIIMCFKLVCVSKL